MKKIILVLALGFIAIAATTKDGKSILKIYRAPSNPNTTKQQTQRAKFGLVVKELNCMRSLFTLTFGGQYGTNRAVSLAMKTAVMGEFPDFYIDYSKLIISIGNIDNAANINIISVFATTIRLNWNTDVFTRSAHNDNVNLVFFNQPSKMVILKQNFAIRSEGNVEVDLPASWIGSEIHCWMYFTTNNESSFSTSLYVGQLVL